MIKFTWNSADPEVYTIEGDGGRMRLPVKDVGGTSDRSDSLYNQVWVAIMERGTWLAEHLGNPDHTCKECSPRADGLDIDRSGENIPF